MASVHDADEDVVHDDHSDVDNVETLPTELLRTFLTTLSTLKGSMDVVTARVERDNPEDVVATLITMGRLC